MDVLPKRLVRMLLEMPEENMNVAKMSVLLIELDDKEGPMAQTLRQTMSLAPLEPLETGFTSTKAFSLRELRTPPPGSRPTPSPASLRKRLESRPHFAIFPIKRNPLDPNPRILIGRSPKSDIVLRQASVSTHHAWLDDDVLGDEKSRNGTRVNGTRVAPSKTADVFPGDEICFGNVRTMLATLGTLRMALLASQ